MLAPLVASPPGHACLSPFGLSPRHLPFTFVQSPKTQFLKGLRFSKVQASSSSLWPTFQGQNALRESAHLGWGS